MSLRDLDTDPVLASQVELVETIVRDIRPLTIVNEGEALLRLLQEFVTDRASVVAAIAVVLLCKARTQMAWQGTTGDSER